MQTLKFSQLRGAMAALVLALAASTLPHSASALQCGEGGAGFDAWLTEIKGVAAKQGISQAGIAEVVNRGWRNEGVVMCAPP